MQDPGAVGVYAAAWSLAYESELDGHGFFTSKLLEALDAGKAEQPAKKGIVDTDELHEFIAQWVDDHEGKNPPQKGFYFRAGGRNWIVTDLASTPEQIEENAERYLLHVDSLYRADPDGMSAAKRHCEDAVGRWKTALPARRSAWNSSRPAISSARRSRAARGSTSWRPPDDHDRDGAPPAVPGPGRRVAL